MGDRPTDHWLWRLSAHEWLAAAQRELEQAQREPRQRRRSLTHARRGAGMALNGVLVHMADAGWSEAEAEAAWGRSYVDHLRAICAKGASLGALGPSAAHHATALMDIPVVPADGLVALQRSATSTIDRALAEATALVEACGHAIGV